MSAFTPPRLLAQAPASAGPATGALRVPAAVARYGASRQAPGHTRPALELCIEDGVPWARVEVRRTRDGQHVLFAGDLLDGRSSGTGPLAELTLAELERLDVGGWFARRYEGERVLTLPAALALARGRLNLILDCRDVDPARLVEEVGAARMGEEVLLLDTAAELPRLRELAGSAIRLGARWSADIPVAEWLAALRLVVLVADVSDELTPVVARAAHAAGALLLASCVGSGRDQPSGWADAQAAGADWVETEHPEQLLARELLARGRDPARITRMALHRGASRYAPENTVAAFDLAPALGANLIEFDVRASADGAHFLLHDSRLDRTTNGHGPIGELPAADVARLDAGAWFGRPWVGTGVPRLDEFLARVPAGVELYVDAKQIAPEALALALAARGLTSRAIVYQDVDYLVRLNAIAPGIRAMPPLASADALDAVVAALRPYAVDAAWSILSQELIARCHAAGVRVFSDALGAHDTTEEHRRAIEWGIDLIQTDRPLCFLRALARPAPSGPRQPG